MTIDDRPGDDSWSDDRWLGDVAVPRAAADAGVQFPQAWVVQLVSGDPTSPDAIVAELVPCSVTVSSTRIVARDGDDVEWSWLAGDIDAFVHGSGGSWSIFDVPGVGDFGISVTVDRVDEFRTLLNMFKGVSIRFQETQRATPIAELHDIGDLPWSTTPPTSGQVPLVAAPPASPLPPPPPAAPIDPLLTGVVPTAPLGPPPASRIAPATHQADVAPQVPVAVAPQTHRMPQDAAVVPVPVQHDAGPVVSWTLEQTAPKRRPAFGRRQVAQTVDEVVSWPKTLAGIDARHVSAWFGSRLVLDRVSLNMEAGKVTALIGPSGCGKSTFLRILNRMHEMIPGAQMDGQVIVDGHDIYDPERKLTDARREIGMVFQKPNPFPAMSIYDNVLASLRLTGVKATTSVKDEIVETCLSKAGLWNEVKDRLRQPGGGLSGGQQQRLCIARALSIRPRVLLMDEPCSALDPTSTRRIEETVMQLVSEVTIVIVTHNMQQAARVSNHCAFFLAEHGTPGVIVEHGPTDAMFGSPQDPRTSDYVMGRFG
jgi:phosphate transport system ATP-binding protein